MDLGTYIFILIIGVMYAFSIAYMDKRIDELREFSRRLEYKLDECKFKSITAEEIIVKDGLLFEFENEEDDLK